MLLFILKNVLLWKINVMVILRKFSILPFLPLSSENAPLSGPYLGQIA